MNKQRIVLVLILLVTLFGLLFKHADSPPCINADEAAYGYNAYSILTTLRDEHGHFLPLRLASFDDFKLAMGDLDEE